MSAKKEVEGCQATRDVFAHPPVPQAALPLTPLVWSVDEEQEEQLDAWEAVTHAMTSHALLDQAAK